MSCAIPTARDDAAVAAAFAEAMARVAPATDAPIVVACSGGGDSLALLRLTLDWARSQGAQPNVVAAVVDHGLRAGSAAEAEQAARTAEALGARAARLAWMRGGRGVDGNVQAAARRARYGLLGEAALAAGARAVLVGHTLDDLAEGFLLRLARGSGVDGLAAMAERLDDHPSPGLTLGRPLLGLRRAELRRFLTERGLAWIDDPSNDDDRFDRVKARRALDALAPLGLTAERLARAAHAMARARAALEGDVERLAASAVTLDCAFGVATLSLPAWRAAPEEIALRLLARALCWTAGAPYPPRLDALQDLAATLRAPAWRARTLHGCEIRPRQACGAALIFREVAAAPVATPLEPGPATPWDGRFAIRAFRAGLEARPLGLGARRVLAAAGAPPPRGLPSRALAAAPGVFAGASLVAAPHALSGAAASIEPRPGLFAINFLRAGDAGEVER